MIYISCEVRKCLYCPTGEETWEGKTSGETDWVKSDTRQRPGIEDGKDFSNFYNTEFSSSLSIPVWKAVSVTPKIAYSFPLSSDARNAIRGISDDGDTGDGKIFLSSLKDVIRIRTGDRGESAI